MEIEDLLAVIDNKMSNLIEGQIGKDRNLPIDAFKAGQIDALEWVDAMLRLITENKE